jgi:hypothetical protein
VKVSIEENVMPVVYTAFTPGGLQVAVIPPPPPYSIAGQFPLWAGQPTNEIGFISSTTLSAAIVAYPSTTPTPVGTSPAGVLPLINGRYWDVNWSPSGNRIAYVYSTDTRLDIFVANADGSNAVCLTRQELTLGLYNILPAWSPDGNYLAFISGSGSFGYSVFVAQSDGNGETIKVAEQPPGDGFIFPFWSEDGQYLAFRHVMSNAFKMVSTASTSGTTAPTENPPLLNFNASVSPRWGRVWSSTSAEAYMSSFNATIGAFTVTVSGSAIPAPGLFPRWQITSAISFAAAPPVCAMNFSASRSIRSRPDVNSGFRSGDTSTTVPSRGLASYTASGYDSDGNPNTTNEIWVLGDYIDTTGAMQRGWALVAYTDSGVPQSAIGAGDLTCVTTQLPQYRFKYQSGMCQGL